MAAQGNQEALAEKGLNLFFLSLLIAWCITRTSWLNSKLHKNKITMVITVCK